MKAEKFDTRTPEQLEAIRLLNHSMKVREIAKMLGDTSEDRRSITQEEAKRIRKRRKQARASRKANRKRGR